MPLYRYQCECGLNFSARGSIQDSNSPIKCEACGAMAPRDVPSNVSVAYAGSTSGSGPQNTGLSSLDGNYDRVIGTDAKQKWGTVRERQNDKRRFLASNPGATGHDLSKLPDGTYRVMAPEERAAAEKGRHIRADIFSEISDSPPKS